MSATLLVDFRDQQAGAMSIVPQGASANAAFGLQGVSVDLLLGDGPLGVILAVGSTTGSPSSFTVQYKVQYALASAATSWIDYASAGLDSVNPYTTFTAASTEAYMLLWHPPVGARYWRVVSTVAFVAGSSPTVGVYAEFIRNKKILGGNGAVLAASIT